MKKRTKNNLKLKKPRWLWVKHAVTKADKSTFDSGRLALFYVVFGVVTFVVLVMCIGSIWSTVFNRQLFDPQSLGIGVGGLLGGVAGVLLGVGGYLFGQGRGDSYSQETINASGTNSQTGVIYGNGQNGEQEVSEGQGGFQTQITKTFIADQSVQGQGNTGSIGSTGPITTNVTSSIGSSPNISGTVSSSIPEQIG